MSTDIVPRNMSSIELAPSAWTLAQKIATTDFVPKALRGKPEAVLACMLAGHEAGIAPMQALSKIHIIEGRPAMAAELMRALVLQHGHEIWIEESTSTRVTLGGKRKNGTRETKVTWTMDDAQRARLSGKDNWKNYPRAMLTARATAELCRAVFPDVLAGISYTIEELRDAGDAVPEDGIDYGPPEVVEATHTPAAGVTFAAMGDTTAKDTAPSEPEVRQPVVSEAPPLPGEDDVIEAESYDTATPDPQTSQIEPEPPLVDDFPPDPEPPIETGGARMTGPQMIAMKYAEFGINDRDDRLRSVSEIIGRTITSGNDLTPAEVSTVLATLNDDGAAAPVTIIDDGAAPEVEVSGRPDDEERRRQNSTARTGDQWRDILKRRGVKAAELLKHAREVSGSSVATLDDIAAKGIDQDLLDFIEDLALSRGK